METKSNTEQVLNLMRILSWVVFVGMLIKAGTYLFSYVFSFLNPEMAQQVYRSLGLGDLQVSGFRDHSLALSFLIAFAGMKAYIAFLVIKCLSSVNLANPFTSHLAAKLESISYALLGTWIISVLNNAHVKWMMKRGGEAPEWNAGEFLFIAGLVFIIAHIFKRGVELQKENELTV